MLRFHNNLIWVGPGTVLVLKPQLPETPSGWAAAIFRFPPGHLDICLFPPGNLVPIRHQTFPPGYLIPNQTSPRLLNIHLCLDLEALLRKVHLTFLKQAFSNRLESYGFQLTLRPKSHVWTKQMRVMKRQQGTNSSVPEAFLVLP